MSHYNYKINVMFNSETAYLIFASILGLCAISTLNLVWEKCIFDIAFFGVCLSMVLWIIMIWNSFGNIYDILLPIIGLFACFNTITILWEYRPIHKRRGLCTGF